MDFLHNAFYLVVEGAIVFFELIGVIVLVMSGAKGFIAYLRHEPQVRLKLAKGMALGLEFKLGGEILRTVIVRELSEIYIVGAIILLRAALAFLINWGIKKESSNLPE